MATSSFAYYKSSYLGSQQYPEAAGNQYFCSGKLQWPELVGMPGCEAATIITRENSNVHPIVLPGVGIVPVTADYHCGRVRIFIDNNGNVIRTPTVG